jgi:Ger(x)C family germination protein
MRKKNIVVIILIMIVASIYGEKLQVSPMEDLNIMAGIGFDINKDVYGNVKYSAPFTLYDFKSKERGGTNSRGKIESKSDRNSEQSSSIINAEADNIGETRGERQLKSSKPFTIGTERIAIIGEEQATYGILKMVNILFFNAKINDSDIFSVCKGKAEDILKFKLQGYLSSADYMEGMVRHSTNYNFLGSQYNLLNIYVTLDSEGKNLVLPYLEIKEETIALTGMALFKGDRLAYTLPMEEGKIMNILREKKGKGILSLQEGPDKYINYDAMVKRKVKCNKIQGKYEFIIELDFKGDIIGNTLYKEMKKENEKEFEVLMGKKIEKLSYDFLYKMKNTYKVDCLNLGTYAVAKYGRETGVDWNDEVSKADIKVKVEVKIDKLGVGQY